ncbi:CRISPR-associated protein Cas4 [Candidatus Woesearchaeota archaeon]|nr:CRISPR-associated protein Cas4 [Candidatus Woesearchaeota archaeon]
MDRQEFLTIKDLMNYHYCNRLIYFENVLKIPQATTIKEYKGRELHEIFTKKSKRNKIVKKFPRFPKEYNIYLESTELNFRTVLDCLIIDKEKNMAFPLEYKYMTKPQRLYSNLTIQIFAEGLLVQNTRGYIVPFGFIKFEKSGDLSKIKVTQESLDQVKETINQINKIIQTEMLPEPTPFIRKCKDCCYWKICKRA